MTSSILARGAAASSLGLAVVVWIVLLAPFVILLDRSTPGSLVSALDTVQSWQPLLISVKAALVVLVLLIAFGTPLAWFLARQRLVLTRMWEAGILALLLMPPLVIGLVLVFLVGPNSFVGHQFANIGLSASNTFTALVVAQIYEAAPYYVLGAQAAFGSVNPALEQQGALLGDRPFRVFRRITLPLAAPGLALALATAWARAMGAFGAVLIIAYHPYGLPMQIYTTLQESGLKAALPVALVLVVVALPLPLAAYAWSAHASKR